MIQGALLGLMIPLFVFQGVFVPLYFFFEYVVNPIARHYDGYTPYVDEECLADLMQASSTAYVFPLKCKFERNYNPL